MKGKENHNPMSIRNLLFGFSFIALVLSACGDAATSSSSSSSSKSGVNISGTVNGGADLGLFLDAYQISNSTRVISKATLDSKGNFELNVPDGLDHGIYRLRLGAKKAYMVFAGDEKNIEINGDINTWTSFGMSVKGSSVANSFLETMSDVAGGKVTKDQIGDVVKNIKDPVSSMFIATQALGASPQAMAIHKEVLQRVSAEMPNSRYARDYTGFIGQVQQQAAKMAVAVGAVAPDFSAPDENGTLKSLSDLKGQVVLLDFWASWCGPCRRENPNVVKVYDKYKAKGFTVMSVSLDGMDSRTASRYPDAAAQEKYIAGQKDRWLNAIKQDNLKWDNHVSDLRKWESAPAQVYGVKSIPATFLIDKDGTIAATNLRGAAAIEKELQRLL